MSTTAASVAMAQEGSFQPPPPTEASSDRCSPSSPGLARMVPFSSGNPRIEETRGIMHLYPEDNSSSPAILPVGRKPLLCVLDVPNHMTYADFCQFCGSFIQHVLEMRIVRNDGVEDRYSVLIGFDSQVSADEFYRHFNGKRFSSLEADACRILYTVDVQYTGSIEHAQSSVISAEQPTCPVCLERLDQDTSGILTTICNHSFHCSCISKWTDSSCPVCRYCQQQPENSTCSVCETTENLWMCVICGFVGCGRYRDGHAIKHWRETQHCYALELETRRVWDYVGDNYVHRLIQSKTDGKLVEFDNVHTNDTCEICECSTDSGISEALFNSKMEAISDEYNLLLTTQLENQRKAMSWSIENSPIMVTQGLPAWNHALQYFESLLLEAEEETQREISEAIEKALNLKLQKIQSKLDKCIQEREFLDELNENLLRNQETWKSKIIEVEESERTAVRLRDEKIQNLEEQLKVLLGRVETLGMEEGADEAGSKEIKEGTTELPEPATAEPSSGASSSGQATKSGKRRT